MQFCSQTDLQEITAGLGNEARAFSGKTVLISGGAGFLGRYFVGVFEQLNSGILNKPAKIIVLDNFITSGKLGEALSLSENIVFKKHNIIEPLQLEEPVDYVIQAAGIASPYYYRKYPLETLDVAIQGTKNMLNLGKANRLLGFLFFSSSEIYGDPDPKHVPTRESYRGNVACLGPRACYDESKRLGETLCQIYHEADGLPTKIVRPFNVYGPGMQEADYRVVPNFASRIIGGKPLNIYGEGDQTRTFCYITDALIGFLKVLISGTPGQAYNIGNPKPEISMKQLAETFAAVTGKKVAVNLIEYPDSYPADEPQRRCPDISKAALQLGYKPQVGLEEGLQRFMAWAQTCYTGEQQI